MVHKRVAALYDIHGNLPASAGRMREAGADKSIWPARVSCRSFRLIPQRPI